MVGIVSYGAYLPRLRLERMSIMASMGWLAPGLFGAAQGERTMANWDEDSLTMAVAAGRDCLKGMDKGAINAVYLALGLTGWVGLCRLIRGETIKHRDLEYVIAARALGASSFRLIFRQILPNVVHLAVITTSLGVLP